MEIPKHMEPLLDGTPLAIERIKHVWPGLPISERAHLLTILLTDTFKEHKAIRWVHHQKQLIDLALSDDNAYIRYLAAKHVLEPLKFDDDVEPIGYLEETAQFEKVKTDPVFLVRLASKEQDQGFMSGELDAQESFWKRPQTERLVLVNGVTEQGEKIAELLRYATKKLLPINLISVDEMFDVLLQYLGGESISERVVHAEYNASHHYDGYYEYSAGKSVKALWEVIPDLPETLAFVLLECLPEKAGFESNIPLQIIELLTEVQLEQILMRDDITLKDLRRKIYKESTNESLRVAAVSSQQFELLDSDILELVFEPQESEKSGNKKIKELMMLATYCGGANLVQMQAICDFIKDAPLSYKYDFEVNHGVGIGNGLQTERAKRLSPSSLQDEIFKMRLFALAKELAPIDNSKIPREPSERLVSQGIVAPYNAWQTYLNLTKVVWQDRWKKWIDHLPIVYIRDFDLPNELFDEIGNDKEDSRQLFGELENVQNHAIDDLVQYHRQLSALNNDLSASASALSSQMMNGEAVAGRRVEVLHLKIEKLARTVNILLLLTVAVLVFVLFK